MPDAIEVTRDCPSCGLPTTHRISKPSSVQCKNCGRGGVYIGKQRIADAQTALIVQQRGGGGRASAAPLPDQSAEWARERPFDRLGRRPRPDGVCAACGTDTDQGSARGTFVWCPECEGFRYDDATAGRRADAIARMDAAELAARQARAAAAERARIDQAPAPDLDDQLEMAGQIGVLRASIMGAARGLRDAPTPQLGMRAANAAARLQALDRAVSDAGKAADPRAALAALQPYLSAEIRDAEQIADEIDQKLDTLEMEEAREAARLERLELLKERQLSPPPPRAIAPPPSPYAPGPESYQPTLPAMIKPWKPCQLQHLFPRVARQVIGMGNTQFGSPEEELSICMKHDLDKVCQGYNYSYYSAIPLKGS